MKELSIEEKARRYDEAIKEAKECHIDGLSLRQPVKEVLEHIFPELAESEDEITRKELIAFVTANTLSVDERHDRWIAWIEKQKTSEEALQYLEENHSPSEVSDFQSAMNIAIAKAYDKGYNDALEKQGEQESFDYEKAHIQQGDFVPKSAMEAIKGEKLDNQTCVKPVDVRTIGYWHVEDVEQKPTDKVEPKFKVDAWITNNIETVQITGYDIDYGYQVDYKGNLQHRDTDIIEKEYHLWSIQDAKDSDILVSYDWIFILKQFNSSGNNHKCYCHYDLTLNYFNDDTNSYMASGSNDFKPATKEQCDQLEKAMADAGYIFDFEKKELKKIGNPTAWSEEDEKIVLSIEQVMNCASLLNIVPEKVDKIRTWLKSLRPQSQWKPSDEQIKALEHFVRSIGESGYNDNTKLLYSLLSDLKKLKS